MTAYEHLLNHDIHPSSQRIVIMDYLLKNRTHPTSNEIYNALKEANPTLSKTTVYNTLKLFEEKGAVLNLSIDEKNAHFDGDTSDHAHLLCTQCGRIVDMKIVDSPMIENDRDCDIHQTHIYMKGVCDICKKANYLH